MRTTILAFLFFSTAIQLFSLDDKMNSVTKIIEDIKNQYAPDKRVAIFEISVIDSANIFTLTGETNIPEAKERLLNNLKTRSLNFIDHIRLLPESELGDKIYGVINLSVANIRSNPDHPAELASQALLGTPVKIYKKASGFYLIQTPDDYIAWVDDDGITPMNRTQLNEWLNSEKIIYTKEYGFSYSQSNEFSSRVSDLTAGNILINLGVENEFYKVKFPDGRTAFVETDNCENFITWLNKNNPTEADIVSTAESLTGIPYLWGGTSAKGMDCSGFTKTVYFLNGIVLSRDASQQVNTGILVDTENGFENLWAGDLLFFGSQETDSTKERITHVAIYIGNYQYIHAAGRIKINSFDKSAADFNEYRLDHFIRAKRILNSIDKNGISSIKKNKFYLGEM
jgi:cell wall-associated NlpC family hydrolase